MSIAKEKTSAFLVSGPDPPKSSGAVHRVMFSRTSMTPQAKHSSGSTAARANSARRTRPRRFTQTFVCVISARLPVWLKLPTYPHDSPVNHVTGVEVVQALGDVTELVNG